MNTRTISPISMLVTSTLIIATGFYIFFNPINLESLINGLIPLLIIAIGVLSIITYVFNRKEKNIKSLLSGVLYIYLGVFIRSKIIYIDASLIMIVGIYAGINFVVQLITTIILYRNKTKRWIFSAISSIISLVCSMILILHPIRLRYLLIKIAGIYLILYGLTILGDFINEVFDKNSIKDNLKRKIRIRLPIIYTLFIPQKLLKKINSLLETSTKQVFEEDKSENSGELEVFIHLSEDIGRGFGHVDIGYKDKIYCYGNYDRSTNRLFGFLSDGVLIEVDKNKYINHTVKERHLISFTFALNEAQYDAIDKKIEEIKEKAVEWHCEAESNPNKVYTEYTNSLYQNTQAKFYKFKSGYFKTYFTFTTNCVKLSDVIIGATGIDSITLNGIITPGIYFDFLNNLYKMNSSIVVKRNLYKKVIE